MLPYTANTHTYTFSSESSPGKALGKAGGKQGESGVCFGESGLSGNHKTICFIGREPTEATTESPLYNIIKWNSLPNGCFICICHAQRAGGSFPHVLLAGQCQVPTLNPIDAKHDIQTTSRSRILLQANWHSRILLHTRCMQSAFVTRRFRDMPHIT